MTQGIIIGVALAVVAYAVLRALARLLMAPWSLDWLDKRAMLARAERDALAAAQDQFRSTVGAWRRATEEVCDDGR